MFYSNCGDEEISDDKEQWIYTGDYGNYEKAEAKNLSIEDTMNKMMSSEGAAFTIQRIR